MVADTKRGAGLDGLPGWLEGWSGHIWRGASGLPDLAGWGPGYSTSWGQGRRIPKGATAGGGGGFVLCLGSSRGNRIAHCEKWNLKAPPPARLALSQEPGSAEALLEVALALGEGKGCGAALGGGVGGRQEVRPPSEDEPLLARWSQQDLEINLR